jgi:translation initiation factor IF-3
MTCQIEPVIRKNDQIRAKTVIYIDPTGKRFDSQNVQYLLKTIDLKHWDLVEVNSSHTPPICKLVSKSESFKKQKAMEEAATRQRLKNREKEIRFGTSMAQHDYDIKLARIKEALEKSFRVKLVIEPKGAINRSPMAKEQLWRKIMDSLAGQYGKDLAIISAPALELRNLVAVVVLSNAKRKGTDNKD